jgi:hypothetical protein
MGIERQSVESMENLTEKKITDRTGTNQGLGSSKRKYT